MGLRGRGDVVTFDWVKLEISLVEMEWNGFFFWS